MNETKIKIKYNIKNVKWLLTIMLLMGNLVLLMLDRVNNQWLFLIIFEIVINILAVFSFVMLSIFPRIYYYFDENGISCQNKKGKEYFKIAWKDVIDINYVTIIGFLSAGMEVDYKEHCIKKKADLIISPKQAKMVYNSIPQIKTLVDKNNFV